MSDQRVSLRRSSNGKSNRVASIWVVSSIDTPVDPVEGLADGQVVEDRRRSRISGSSFARLRGATTGATVLRCWSCLGGSMAMKLSTERADPPGAGARTAVR
jgi:hypothetical protein